MKEKILSELTKKYTGQASKKYLENLAERLAETIEKEEDIQGVIDELEASPVKIGDLQTEGDRRVAELKKELEALKKKPEPPSPDPDDKLKNLNTEGTSQEVLRELESLKKEIAQERKERQRQAARAALMERIKDKQIPKALIDDATVDSVDDVDLAVERLTEKADAIRKELGTPSQEPPRKGDHLTTSAKQVEEDIKKWKPR